MLSEYDHAVMVLDQEVWYVSNAVAFLANVTLVPLPPYSPELYPVECVWLYLKERFLSHRLLNYYDAIVDSVSNSCNRLLADSGRIKSLCSYAWFPAVNVYSLRYHLPGERWDLRQGGDCLIYRNSGFFRAPGPRRGSPLRR